MNARSARHLRQTLNAGLDLFAGNHHQIGHLIDDNNDIRQQLWLEFLGLEDRIAGLIVKAGLDSAAEHLALGQRILHAAIEAVDIAHAHLGHLAIAFLHLAHDPFERDNRLLGIGHNRRQQMRDTVIDAEFQHLGINHNHPAFFWCQLVKQ